MKKTMIVLLMLMLISSLHPQAPGPPEQLEDSMFSWLQGEWEGSVAGPMGETKDWIKYEIGLDGQFLLMQATSKAGTMNYSGMGAVTLDPQSGKVTGTWIDNFRGHYTANGRREGNKLLIDWEGSQGKTTRITERIGPDKFTITVKMPAPDGSTAEYKGEFRRTKKMAEK